MSRRRSFARWASPFVLAALAAAGIVVAQPAKPEAVRAQAAIVPATALCTKAAPNGQAWITVFTQGENAFLGRLELAPGAKVAEHRDATEEYLHVLQGRGTMRIDGKAHEVGPGTTVFMPAHARVSFENGPEHLVALQVFAGPSPAAKYASWKGCEVGR